MSIALAVAAEAQSALLSGRDDLLTRALARIEDVSVVAMPEIPALFVEHLRTLGASRVGHARVASERLDRLLAHPRLAASPPLEARVCAIHALRSLDELGDPDDALALARRARQIAEAARLPPGIHTALTLRVEAEALFRQGRIAEAGQVFDEADRIFVDVRFPTTVVLPAQLRYLLVCGRSDALQAQADRLAAVALPSMRAIAQAFAALFAATAATSRGDDSDATLAAYARAEQLSEGWGPLHRDVVGAYANAALIEGRLDDARAIFEAAAATFEASGDRIDATFARYGAARMMAALGDADAEPRAAALEVELAEMTLPRPEFVVRAVGHAVRALADARRSPTPVPAGIPPALEIALQRLAVSGATVAMIRRELIAVTRELVGAPVALTGPGEPADPDPAVAWFDVVGTAGLRLGVAAALDEPARATVRVIALVAGLALETAGLRQGDGPATEEVPELPGLVAASPAMRRLLADVRGLAGSRATVVITGESGVGKEVIARALHQLSPRSARPYIAFNCAAVPHELFEGQLFGYRKGAFTGAIADHAGVVRAADGGTLFLDEVGELPLDIQPKLLRFLDNAEVFPLGAQRAVTVDVRVVAATNRDLAAEVRAGRFREDLYYRLLVVPLAVPPLRVRRDDIVPLARLFAGLAADGGRPPAFAPDALAALTAHAWPGNVRELRNVIARALAYAPRPDVITRARLGL
ncbi:MAG TPA: sigma 54-interacting transcriptional regulator [Kofleriaceae bacterium]|nr:sigma 54-interacting transcriptional regulator [Kofleriaceae bacterium]